MTIESVAMTREQVDLYLSEPRNAVMGTARRDGSAQLSAIWFLYREGKIYSTLYNSSAKYFNIRRNPRVAICVNAAHPDARSVTIYGTAELMDKDSETYPRVAREIAYLYHDSAEAAEAYLDESEAGAASVVVVTPYRVISQDYN